MILVKTDAGRLAMKDRSAALAPRQRSAFILFDGKKTLAEVLQATAGMGLTSGDVTSMVDAGLLAEAPGGSASMTMGSLAVGGSAASRAHALPATGSPSQGGSEEGAAPRPHRAERQVRSTQERYRDAYPVATRLTAALGLRGFRLNLAVEGVGSFEQLEALAPKIREAVGPGPFVELDRALHD